MSDQRSTPEDAHHEQHDLGVRLRPTRIVSGPRRSPEVEAAERELRAALRQQLWDGFEKAQGWPTAWDIAWAENADYRASLVERVPELRVCEEAYRDVLRLDWRRWCER